MSLWEKKIRNWEWDESQTTLAAHNLLTTSSSILQLHLQVVDVERSNHRNGRTHTIEMDKYGKIWLFLNTFPKNLMNKPIFIFTTMIIYI